METKLTIKKEEQKKISELVTYAKGFVINSDKDVEDASVQVRAIKDMKNALEEQRTSFTKPINESLKNINGFFKKFSDPLTEADTILRKKMSQYRTAQEEERRKKQAELDKQWEKEQARLNKIAEKKGIEAPQIVAPSVQEAPQKLGKIGFKTVWDFEITDLSQVPVEFLQLDMVKVRTAIREGQRDIKGLRIFQTERTSL